MGFLPWLDAGFYQQTLYAQDWICLANAQHSRISSGTGYQLLDSAVPAQHLTRQIRLELPGFTVKQYWHARYHHDSACRWLRSIFAELFMKSGGGP